MIISKDSNETWLEATQRYAELDGLHAGTINLRFEGYLEDGYDERRAAFLTLADFGVEGAEVGW